MEPLKEARDARGVVLPFAFLPTGSEVRGKHWKGGGHALHMEFYRSILSEL